MQIRHQITKKRKMNEVWATEYSSDHEIPHSKLPQCDKIIGITFASSGAALPPPSGEALPPPSGDAEDEMMANSISVADSRDNCSPASASASESFHAMWGTLYTSAVLLWKPAFFLDVINLNLNLNLNLYSTHEDARPALK